MPILSSAKTNVEGFYYFLSPPKAINKPKSLLNKEQNDEDIFKCTPNILDCASRRSSRSKRLSQIWNQTEEFYQAEVPTTNQETVEKDDVEIKEDIIEKESEQELKEEFKELVEEPIVTKNVDVGIQFPEEEPLLLDVEPTAYRIVSSAMESAMVNLLTSEIPSKDSVFINEETSLLVIRTLSEELVEEKISYICQLFMQNGIIQERSQSRFESEVDLATTKLEQIYQKLDEKKTDLEKLRERCKDLIRDC